MAFHIRPMANDEWGAVAGLIHDSTNGWYEAHGKPKIFRDGPESTRLFCEVYEALDPGCCLIAEDDETGALLGSCFYHPRSTHVSLGIMNVHPDRFGRGVARALLKWIIDFADQRSLPIRLVSSAMNLDSFSLYNRAGFVPQATYQDMLLSVPDEVASVPVGVRSATADDVDAMVALEREVVGIERAKDFAYFIENALGIWKVWVRDRVSPSRVSPSPCPLEGFIVSARHPASAMIGPGVMRDEQTAIELVRAAATHHRGGDCVVVTPCRNLRLVNALYDMGARNCELHFGQVRGTTTDVNPSAVVIPTFMPETG